MNHPLYDFHVGRRSRDPGFVFSRLIAHGSGHICVVDL